jgi:hypothetical protein
MEESAITAFAATTSANDEPDELSAGLEWLMKTDPRALLEMPTTVMLLDAVQGNPEPRVGMRVRVAHLLEVEGLGYCVYLMWDTEAHLTRKERTVLAGHVRQLGDTAVAPWNRYPELRRRREAFVIWVRHLREERVDAQHWPICCGRAARPITPMRGGPRRSSASIVSLPN